MYILFGILIIGGFLLYRMITRMIKYQNFKSNVILRIALEKDMKELAEREQFDLDNIGEGIESATSPKLDEIIIKISKAIDEEIDSSPMWDWKDLIIAIRAEEYFRNELSDPFSRAFYPKEIIKRHLERNKEYLKKKKQAIN